jgi:type I restriction enzyme S subunit
MIPEGWRQLALSEIAASKIVYGIVQAGPHVPEGVPYLKSSDVGGKIDISNLQKTAPEIHARYRRSAVRPGDIVISLRGNTGETSIVPLGLLEANLTQGTARIAVAAEFDSDFIYHQIASSAVQRRIHSATKGSTFVEITLDDLRKVEMLCPASRCEQSRVAQILSTWDRAIETVEALIANARAQKKALMQSLLTEKKRLPWSSEEWGTFELGELCRIAKGEQLGRLAMLEHGTIPVLNGGIGPSGYTDRANNPGGCIAISEGGNSCGFVSLIETPFWCGGHCYALNNLGVDRSFLFAVLKHREAEIMALRVGSGLPNIQKKALSRFRIHVPSRAEQEAIGERADIQDQTTSGLKAQLSSLRREKSALMQQLLTGKRRVKVDQREAA